MKIYRIISLLTLLFIAVSASGQHRHFQYRRKLDAIAKEDWYAIKLPPDIFRHADPEFRDFRIYSISDTDTTEIPYLLQKRTSEIRREEVDLPVLNKSRKDGVLYLMFELKDGQKVNLLDLEFAEPEYFATVKLEGSEDRKEWFELADGQRIFSIRNASGNFDYGVVDFGLTDYRYLRVSVRSDTPLTFVHASFRKEEVKKGTFEDIPARWAVREDKTNKQTGVNITLDHYRPVSTLTLELENGGNDFYRYATLSRLADSTKAPKGWIRHYEAVNEGYLTSFKPNVFTVDDELAKELNLSIRNFDNPALTIKNVKVAGAVVELIARMKPGNLYLYYGNASLQYPVYDLGHFAEKIPTTTAPATLAAEEAMGIAQQQTNPLFQNKVWLWLIMGAVIGVLGFFTLRMMKNH